MRRLITIPALLALVAIFVVGEVQISSIRSHENGTSVAKLQREVNGLQSTVGKLKAAAVIQASSVNGDIVSTLTTLQQQMTAVQAYVSCSRNTIGGSC